MARNEGHVSFKRVAFADSVTGTYQVESLRRLRLP